MTDFLSNGNTSRNTFSYHQSLKTKIIISSVDSNLQVRYSATIIPNTITHDNYTLPKLRITPRTYLFWDRRRRGSYIGPAAILGHWWRNSTFGRSTRLYVDGHLWMLEDEDWVMPRSTWSGWKTGTFDSRDDLLLLHEPASVRTQENLMEIREIADCINIDNELSPHQQYPPAPHLPIPKYAHHAGFGAGGGGGITTLLRRRMSSLGAAIPVNNGDALWYLVLWYSTVPDYAVHNRSTVSKYRNVPERW